MRDVVEFVRKVSKKKKKKKQSGSSRRAWKGPHVSKWREPHCWIFFSHQDREKRRRLDLILHSAVNLFVWFARVQFGCLKPFGGVDRETPLVVLSGVGGGVLVSQFVGPDECLGQWWWGRQMRSLGDETVLGVGVVFHLVHDTVGAGVQVVSLSDLSLRFCTGVLQVSGFSGGDSVTGLVAVIEKKKNTRVLIFPNNLRVSTSIRQ